MINLIVNDQIREFDLPLGTSLVDVIRDNLKLPGTKIGCREGDCGACTVLVGELDGENLKYKSMASCILPLGNTRRKHIVTIEGLNLDGLTPIQKAFVEENGTQCGFCTPGFIMSVVGFCLSDKKKTFENIKIAVAGNICRCTGYKSIERALSIIVDGISKIDETDRIAWLADNGFIPAYFNGIKNKLKEMAVDYSPKRTDADYIMGGGTDLLVQELDEVEEATIDFIQEMPGLSGVRIENGKCFIGSTTTITELFESEALNKMFPKMRSYINLIASHQIRNMATVGGNFANGSPIGDLAIMFQALDGTLVLNEKGKKREIKLKDFFVGYKTVNKKPDELIECVYFNVPGENTHFSFEKIGKRIHLDMATVNSALVVEIKDGIIKAASYSVGGLGATIRNMEKTSGFLVGKKISNKTFIEANKVAQSEITPRSRPEYKRLLVKQQLLCHLMSFAPEALGLEALQ